MTPLKMVRSYHAATKHHFNRFARNLGYMDWDLQPNPFRRFEGAPRFRLPLAQADDSPAYNALYEPGTIPPRPFNAENIGWLFEHAMGLSAWKAIAAARWALRCNPSSGNLHPTESYLITGPCDGLADHGGVFHYAPDTHSLELRAEFGEEHWKDLLAGKSVHCLVGISSIHWRESWKYGERAYRYCQHDAGHALAAIALAAAALGWETRAVPVSDGVLSALLGLDRQKDFPVNEEHEAPDALLAIHPPGASKKPLILAEEAVSVIAEGPWRGTANRLSAEHHYWPIIDDVAKAAWRESARPPVPWSDSKAGSACPGAAQLNNPITARGIFRQRRSAVDMDAESGMSAASFYTAMARVMPRPASPWTALEPPCCVDLGLFVHRVEGIAPGLYWLARGSAPLDELREAAGDDCAWERPAGCPDDLPLYLLRAGNVQSLAAAVSCQQSIAADGAFAAAMMARVESALRGHGPWWYRRLHWETGVIGQVLYLEAEAAGLRSTGIGCFFDEPAGECFGLGGDEWQSLYHFTIGGPLEDGRLTTLPGYDDTRHSAAAGWERQG